MTAGRIDWPAFLPAGLMTAAQTRRRALGRPCRRHVVALFADVAGFTTMAEALGRASPHGSEELTTLINDVFSPIVELVHHDGDEVAYFSGDAVMVIFPATARSPGRAARRALRCAWEIQG